MSQEAVITSAAATEKPAAKSFVSHAKLIGVITFVSRILGMTRESIAANFFGAGAVWSAFTVAFTIPNLFRKLLGEGALSATFIPLYAQAVKKEENGETSDVSANDFAAASVNLLCMICGGIIIVGELILLALKVWWHTREDYRLAIVLTMVMLPYVALVCGTAFLGAILQVHHRFAAITATAVVSNVCLIIAMFIAAKSYDLTTESGRESGVWILSISVLVAGVLQILMLQPSLRWAGFRFKFMLHIFLPAVQKMLLMSVPVAIGAGVLQLGVMFDEGISFMLAAPPDHSHFQMFGHWIRYPMVTGAAARLNWAQFMYQFPLGVFAIALATAIFPKLSANAMDEGRGHFKSVLRQGLEASLFLGLPASIGMVLVRYPAVSLLFQHGKFTQSDTNWVALSMAIYSSAIWAFSLTQILSRAYYALHDTITPLIWSASNLLINLIIELPLIWTKLGESGMAVGTLVSFTIQAILMLWMLDRRAGGLELRKSFAPIGKMVIASALMLLACLGVQYIPGYPHGPRKIAWAEELAILMILGGGVYFAACAAMGIDVTKHIRLKRRADTRT